MGTAWIECWKCDQCAHKWIKTVTVPTHCAKCRSRKWNASAGAEVANGAGYAGCEPARTIDDSAMRKHSPAGSIPAPLTSLKAQLQASIDLIKERGSAPVSTEIPICGKTWWEDGEQYECLMDKGHREQKHGMRDLVQRLDT